MNLKKEPMINSTTYYAASKISDRLYLLLASKRTLSGEEIKALQIGRQFVTAADDATADSMQRNALDAVAPKLRLAAGKEELTDILKAVAVELDAVIAKGATDPGTNKLSSVLFRELTEYYVKMRQGAEARGL